MIKNNACLKCHRLFSVTAYNNIRFCNGKEGDFIDNYNSREAVFEDFKAKYLRHNGHCLQRKNFNLASDYSDDDMFNYRIQRAIKKRIRERYPYGPSRIFCFPTYRCNNDCRHCFVGDKVNKRELSLSQAKTIIRRHAEDYSRLHLGGGEPTLFKELINLIGFSKDLGLEVRLYSNCRRMSNSAFAKKIVTSGIDGLTVPLHSHKPSAHDFITRRKGSFNETLRGIDNLKGFGFSNIHVMIVTHKYNYRDSPEMVKFLAKKGIKDISIESLAFAGSAVNNLKYLAIKVSKIVRQVESAFDILIEKGISFFTATLPLCLFHRRYWRYFCNARYDLMVTNFPHGDGSDFRKLYKNMGTSLSKKCIDCSLKIFCPGLLSSYYYFFGDDEFKPEKTFRASEILPFLSCEAVKRLVGR